MTALSGSSKSVNHQPRNSGFGMDILVTATNSHRTVDQSLHQKTTEETHRIDWDIKTNPSSSSSTPEVVFCGVLTGDQGGLSSLIQQLQ